MPRRESRQWPHEQVVRGYLLLFAASIFLVVGLVTPDEFRAVGAGYIAVIPLSLGALSAAWAVWLLRGRLSCGVALLAAAVAVAGFGLMMQPLAHLLGDPIDAVFGLAALLATLGIWYLAIAARRRG